MRGIISGFSWQPQKRHWMNRLMIVGFGAIAAYGLFKLPTQAATFGIFNRLPSGYYNQGRQSPTHNVLPPIYNYQTNDTELPRPYAINFKFVTGDHDVSKLYQYWRQPAKYGDLKTTENFLEKWDEYSYSVLNDYNNNDNSNYLKYVKNYKESGYASVGDINRCAQSLRGHSDATVVGKDPMIKDSTKDHKKFHALRDKCRDWFQTGFNFIKASIAGVPQSQANNSKLINERYNAVKKDPNKRVTLQYMGNGGTFNYPGTNIQVGSDVFKRFNTAINGNGSGRNGVSGGGIDGNDVIGYAGGINESLAVVIWDYNPAATRIQDKYRPQWLMRLACANPLGANDGGKRDVENPIEVSGRVVSNKISTAGTAEVEFRYSIAKTVANFPANAKTPIQYQFSGTPQAGFNHGNLEITGSSGAPGFNVGQRLGSNPAIFDTDIRGGKVEFVEKYTINAKANNADVTNIAGGSKTYVVCRTIQTQAAQGRPHNFTAAEVKKLKHDARACVRVSEQNDAANTEGSIDVLGFEPFMTPIAEIVNPGRGGINTRVLRPKQWVPRQQKMTAVDPCRSPYLENGAQRIERQCRNKCRPKKVKGGYNWRLEYVCRREWDDESGRSYCSGYTSEQDGETRCTWDANNPPDSGGVSETPSSEYEWTATRIRWWWVRDGNCSGGRRGDDDDDGWNGYRWQKKFTREYGTVADEHIGTDENRIECEVIDADSYTPSCGPNVHNCCPPTRYWGTCIWKERRPMADWSVTKIIFKPENGSGNRSPEKDGLPPLNNEEMTLDSSESPLQYYCGKNSPVRNDRMECFTVSQGKSEIDNTKVFSLEAPGWNKHGLPSGMTWPYMPMNIVINPAGTDNYYYKTPPSAEGRFKSNILGGIDKSSPGIADADANIVPELPTGTVVCYGLSMTPWKIDQPGRWAHSQPKCYVVSKKPYFAVENGMVVSNGQIRTKTSKRSSGRTVGSWAEYNAIANGSIDELFSTNLGSFNGVLTNSNQWHKLTFQNTGSLGSFGSDPTTELIDQVRFFTELGNGRYAGTVVYQHGSNQQNVNNLGEGIHVFNGNTKITGSVGVAGRTVIVVDGDLTIAEGVGSVNAWVIVSGRLSTSDRQLTESEVARGLNGAQQLVINGPVRAQSISLLRTYGSGRWSPSNNLGKNRVTGEYGSEQFTQPAEIFRDTAETYIWSYENSVDKGRVQTVYLREVAPRY